MVLTEVARNSVDLTSAVQRQAPIALNSLEHVVRTTNGVVYDYFSLVTIPSALDKTKPSEQGLVFVAVTEKKVKVHVPFPPACNVYQLNACQ